MDGIMRTLKLTLTRAAKGIIESSPMLWRMELFRLAAQSIGVKYAGFPGNRSIFEAPIFDRVGWIHHIQRDFDDGTELFRSGSGTLVDVGANIGLVCIPTKQALPGVDVYAVEPDADNCECLRMNAFRAGVSGMTILNRAAYRREGVLDFERSADNAGDHRVRAGRPGSDRERYHESARIVLKVQASTLDSMVPVSGLKQPVVLKCDVQGAEVDVLVGAAQLLAQTQVLISEFWPYGLKRAGASVDELAAAISGFPYGARFDVEGKASPRLVPVKELIEQMKRFYAEETGIAHWDVLLAKKPL
jgi:FkbM family methyltransferase